MSTRGFGALGAIFIAFGVAYGLFRGDGLFLGAVAGALLYAFVLGVGFLAMWIGGK
jgi:hypothetical protein